MDQKKPDLIIFHSLFPQNLIVLNELKLDIKVCWFSWGGDINLSYNSIFNEGLEAVTFEKYYNNSKFKLIKHKFWNFFKSSFPYLYSKYYHFRTKEDWPNLILKKNLHKISFVNTVTINERELFRKSNFNGEFVHIPIGTIEYLMKDVNLNLQNSGDLQVFVGQSAYSSNNQLDVFKRLSQMSYDGKIYCPLSYGDLNYSKYVENFGNDLFKERFIPLKDYISKSTYFEVIGSCSFYINNSIIQQFKNK